MGPHDAFDDLGPGLHLLREAEPLKRAGSMAVNLRADLCATLPQADATLAERSRLPSVDAPTLSTLQQLARRLARAERIASRTRDRAVVDVGHRLASTGAGLAVHPTTIRDRAAAVDKAHEALTVAEELLEEHAEREANAMAEAEAGVAAVDEAAAEASVRRVAEHRQRLRSALSTRRSRATGAIVAGFGIGFVLWGLGAPLWLALVPALLATIWALRHLRPPEDDGDLQAREEASSLLFQVAATTEEVFGARRVSRELGERRSLLEARRDRALEELRVAQRAWQELAGEGVGTDQLDEVVRRYDPQHEDARLLAGETVGVRTVDGVLHHFRQRWQAFWRELGLEAPAPANGEQAVRDLAAKVSRPVVLVGPATVRGAAISRVAPAAAVVVLDGPPEEAEPSA